MPMLAIFGAEVIGAEILAAEAAAAAAEAAVIEAAQVAAAEAAAQQAAQEAARQAAAQTAVNSGITGVPDPVFQNVGGQGVTTPQTFPVNDGGITSVPQAIPPVLNTPPMGLEMPGAYSPGNIQGADPNFFNPSATVAPGQGPLPNPQFQLNAPSTGQGMRLGTSLESIPPSGPMTSVLQPPSALENGMNTAVKFAKEHPFTAMTGAYMGASALGLLNPSGATFNNTPYDGPLSKYKLSPNFQAGNANPANFQYNPATNRRYAGGGILNAMGGDSSGGISANGNLDLHIPIGFGNNNNNVGGYQSVGASNMSPSTNSNFAPQQMLGANNNIDVGGNESIPRYAEGDLVDEDLLLANNPQGIQGADQYGQGAGMGYLEMGGNYGAAPVMSEDQRRYERDVAMGNMSMNNNPQGLKGADPYGQGAAMGYVEGYARGGSLSDSIEQYQKMLGGQQQAAPARSADVGIYYDQDPDTRYQDALTAAQIRQAKVNQRAYVSPPVAKRPTPMGQLQMASVKPKKQSDSSGDIEARHGGIMHASLGDYAAGGNPRLLKGPGDGMSDNIPATINGRQPARLADGEFVIPADVVSHLGNGSTEAGAKHLHAMMDKVRKARTGNPKQGKQINAKKYMPK